METEPTKEINAAEQTLPSHLHGTGKITLHQKMRKPGCLVVAFLSLGELWNPVHLSFLICKMGILIPFLPLSWGRRL